MGLSVSSLSKTWRAGKSFSGAAVRSRLLWMTRLCGLSMQRYQAGLAGVTALNLAARSSEVAALIISFAALGMIPAAAVTPVLTLKAHLTGAAPQLDRAVLVVGPLVGVRIFCLQAAAVLAANLASRAAADDQELVLREALPADAALEDDSPLDAGLLEWPSDLVRTGGLVFSAASDFSAALIYAFAAVWLSPIAGVSALLAALIWRLWAKLSLKFDGREAEGDIDADRALRSAAGSFAQAVGEATAANTEASLVAVLALRLRRTMRRARRHLVLAAVRRGARDLAIVGLLTAAFAFAVGEFALTGGETLLIAGLAFSSWRTVFRRRPWPASALAGLERAQGLRRRSASTADPSAGALSAPELKGGVSLRVDRCVAPGASALQSARVELASLRSTAFLGSSAERRAFADLLLGACRLPGDQICVDGLVLAPRAVRHWRSQVALIPSRPCLIDDSLAANLRLTAPFATPRELERVLVAANLGSLLSRCPQGLETPIFAGRSAPTAQELYRLGVARALLRRPRLLLIQDPQVGDVDNETRVVDLIRALRGRCTVLWLTSRDDSLSCADTVAVCEGGVVVESGSYTELLDRPGSRLAARLARKTG